MKKSFLLLFSILIMGTSVKADSNKSRSITTITVTKEVPKKIGNVVIFTENYEKDSTCSDVTSKNGCTMYHLRPPSQVKGFTVDQYIPTNIMQLAYDNWKSSVKKPMPIYDDSYVRSSFSRCYTVRTDCYTRKQIVINAEGTSMSYNNISREEKHTSVISCLLIILFVMFGYITGISYHQDSKDITWRPIALFIIFAIIEIIFLRGTAFNDGELLISLFGFIAFLLGSLFFQASNGIVRLIFCTIFSSALLVACYKIFGEAFNDIFFPKLLIGVFITTALFTYLKSSYDECDRWTFWFKNQLFNKEFWVKIKVKVKNIY